MRYINKKTKEREKEKSIEKLIYFLSDKKENNSSSFINLFLYNNKNNDSPNDISNKKFIKVNTDNCSKSKNKIKSPEKINNDKKTKKNLKEFKKSEDDNMSISEKIDKFESRIDNLLDLINDFENKFIYSEETQRIKDQFYHIMNKKIYKNKISKDYFHKSWIKTEKNNDIFSSQENSNILKDNCFINIKNINININNNNYENNYYITQTSQNIQHPQIFRKKQNYSEKKINININNNNIFKKSNIKSSKKKKKCISNDIKNKILKNYKDKSKVIKLPLDFIMNNSNTNKNNSKNSRYNHSYKEFQKPLTERNKKDNKYKNNDKDNFDKKIKSANKKKHNCLMINNNSSKNEEIAKKPLIKKEGMKKINLLKSKKKLFNKNITPSSIIRNSLVNNTIIRGKSNNEKKIVKFLDKLIN